MPVRINEAGEGVLSCTHTSLRRAARHLTQIYDDALAPSGLTSSQAQLMSQIDQMGGHPGGEGPSLQALARRLNLQVSALSHAFRPLTRDGLVTILPDDKDGRVKRAVLTDKGKRQTDIMYGLWAELTERMDAILGEGIGDRLRDLADQVSAIEPKEVVSRG